MGLFSLPSLLASFLQLSLKRRQEDFWDAPGGSSPSLDSLLAFPRVLQALLKMDCQGLVVRLIQDFVLLTTAVEVAQRWRELAEKLAKVSKQQMDAYEAPHRDKSGSVDSEVRAGIPSSAQILEFSGLEKIFRVLESNL